MASCSYYEILGVDEKATNDEIKKAYRGLSLKHHPDRGGDTEKFQQISEAYETLSDSHKKMEYDMRGGNPFFGGGGGGMCFTHTTSMSEPDFNDINNILNMVFGGGLSGGPGGGPGGGRPSFRVFHDPHERIFQNLQKPPPIVKQIEISLKQAYEGVLLQTQIERKMENLRQTETEEIIVNIPTGVEDNEVIILRDRGHVLNEHIRGDIKIIVKITNKTEFIRSGLDIIFKKKISLKEALCGFSFEIEHLNEKTVCFNNKINPTIITPGFRKIVPNLGMTKENTATGNLIVEFEVEFPPALDAGQISKLNEIL